MVARTNPPPRPRAVEEVEVPVEAVAGVEAEGQKKDAYSNYNTLKPAPKDDTE